MIDDTKMSNPFESWLLHVFRSPYALKIRRDDPTLGTAAPDRPAMTTPELV